MTASPTGASTTERCDIDLLFKLRLVVARVGEMDLARWWNTEGQLGALGATVVRRGFPRTHRFAQARSVFAVARRRCEEIYDPPGMVTLWKLPMALEDEFELRWAHWLDEAARWEPFFQELESCSPDLQAELTRLGLVSGADVDEAGRLRRSAENRAVVLPGEFSAAASPALLALGFGRGVEGGLAVPVQAGGDA